MHKIQKGYDKNYDDHKLKRDNIKSRMIYNSQNNVLNEPLILLNNNRLLTMQYKKKKYKL